ncbi:MAG TPA: hypothetical protein PLD59_08785 [Tepidisphaeraceae bacterium]|nr:hypothetical protein [Tepidisphaeraceae bacterium]
MLCFRLRESNTRDGRLNAWVVSQASSDRFAQLKDFTRSLPNIHWPSLNVIRNCIAIAREMRKRLRHIDVRFRTNTTDQAERERSYGAQGNSGISQSKTSQRESRENAGAAAE